MSITVVDLSDLVKGNEVQKKSFVQALGKAYEPFFHHPKAYPDCTAGVYLDERLKEIGLKK